MDLLAAVNFEGNLNVIGYALAAALPAYALGRLISAALDGIARQPEAAGQLRTTMLIGMAFVEALALFGFVLAFALNS